MSPQLLLIISFLMIGILVGLIFWVTRVPHRIRRQEDVYKHNVNAVSNNISDMLRTTTTILELLNVLDALNRNKDK